MKREEVEGRRVALIREIEAVFDGVSREGGITLHEATALDDYTDPEESRLKDTESRWQDVPDAVLYQHGQDLGYLDPLGFRYYLPALLTWVLRHLDDGYDDDFRALGSNTYAISLLFALRSTTSLFVPNLNNLTWRERNVVAKFLQFRDELDQLEYREHADKEYLEELGRPMTDSEFQESYWSSYESEEGRLLRAYWNQFLESEPDAE